MIFFISIGNNFWFSDSIRNFFSLNTNLNFKDIQGYVELRDYRSPSIIYGQNYNFNIFRAYLKYKLLTIGDNTISFGRGLSLFLSYDEKAILESYLRGIVLEFNKISIYGGIKRKWLYYSSDNDTTYILGSYFQYRFFGVNGLYYKNQDYGFLTSSYLDFSNFYVEIAYRNGYDIFTFSNNEGYGLFSSISFFGIKLEYCYYDKIYESFNLPATINSYGLLSSSARNETGLSLSYAYKNFLAEISRTYDIKWSKNLLNYYNISFYNEFSKIRAYRVFSINQNLDDYVLSLDLKIKSLMGAIEYRNRKNEAQPFISVGYIYEFLNIAVNYRRFFNSNKFDYFFELKYDNTKNMIISIGYGEFSGDIVCSSGICRYEPPFKGLKSSINFNYSF
ncbi:MAG: hypothetical protein N2504_01780 [candidate division WOR-3 bacterium]|nr:hypothetical protein [candidate division WOR-3 bacterium]MCX7947301.1 hypothetical protein [candidate division WOR-3 bacterium]MDW8150142.1 hypothetical protein [candidate division WOR-3 bacterium]